MSELLWQPAAERIKSTNMYDFMEYVNARCGTHFANYDELYSWSIEEGPAFWEMLWAYSEVIHSRSYDQVVDDIMKMPGARWFEGARLNFAENLLRYRDDRIALSFKGETRPTLSITYSELYQQVARLAKSLRDMGIQPGDRIAGFMPNMIETIVAMLAATSIGAIWSSCSPDFGIKGVLDRFGQIEPRVLFTADGYLYNGKEFDSLNRISEIIKDLPSIEKIVVVPYKDMEP
ncbi:MAG: AMP-binding protein, partial [Deltaproteobacteria bacterium]